MRELLKEGTIVKYFKRDYCKKLTEDNFWQDVYFIAGYAKDSNTKRPVAVYFSIANKDILVKDLEEFMGEVDKEKYPDTKQKYIFEEFNVDFNINNFLENSK